LVDFRDVSRRGDIVTGDKSGALKGARITRVVLRNYRSIAACDVRLGPLTFLVGPNGSGKSNFLHALGFVADALVNSLPVALQGRGGVAGVRWRGNESPSPIGIRIEFRLQDDVPGYLAFEFSEQEQDSVVVIAEECQVAGVFQYRVERGKVVVQPAAISPPATSDRLYLVNAAGHPPFLPVYQLLSNIRVYNIIPAYARAIFAGESALLAHDGRNLAAVLGRIQNMTGGKARVEEYLSRIVPGVEGVDSVEVGSDTHLLEFRQAVEGRDRPWKFTGKDMSDGTIRSLGVLTALFQPRVDRRISVMGIEEPELTLHPAAAAVLRDALWDASRYAQVLVTSHSPELLDDRRVQESELLSVVSRRGMTQIGPVDEAARSALRDRLLTAGELLRADQLEPDPSSALDPDQLHLFGPEQS
jgi:predicted ATPase